MPELREYELTDEELFQATIAHAAKKLGIENAPWSARWVTQTVNGRITMVKVIFAMKEN